MKVKSLRPRCRRRPKHGPVRRPSPAPVAGAFGVPSPGLASLGSDGGIVYPTTPSSALPPPGVPGGPAYPSYPPNYPGAPGSPGPGSQPVSNDPMAAARDYCVQRINQYRATLGLPALMRAPTAEACVDRQAASDGQSKTAHGAFGQCNEGAQNECPGWPGALSQALPGCLDAMWREGPGGGHYDTMSSPSYRYVACGFAVAADGSWWAIQDFR